MSFRLTFLGGWLCREYAQCFALGFHYRVTDALDDLFVPDALPPDGRNAHVSNRDRHYRLAMSGNGLADRAGYRLVLAAMSEKFAHMVSLKFWFWVAFV
jgi:hypothetical protein